MIYEEKRIRDGSKDVHDARTTGATKTWERNVKIKEDQNILQLCSFPKKQVQYEKRFGFRPKSSFSRAVSRAHQSVPGTSTKRRSVAKALAEKSGLM